MLAAGAGKRLRPLTDKLPKPLAPVGGRPVAARVLERLSRLDLDAVALNLHHGAELIERVLGPGPVYLREQWLRGTAGALAGAADFLRHGDFLVASADGVHEVDLSALVARHRDSGAAATITAKRIPRPETCALVELDEHGLVQRFVEKPPTAEVFTDLASIGIYCFTPAVLDLIPHDRPFDIARELIPALLQAGMPVAAYETGAWWSDIGSPGELLAANLEYGFVSEDSLIADGAVIEAPVMIGPGSTVGWGARVSGSLVFPGAIVVARVTVENAIHGDADDVLSVWLR
ncbi:MAG: mannose-phosphate guanylyltransferase [Thermoleophilaceae bacterium]|nr:mannose-phosphate guanylyltransferase [Thermoleophilaceae bacterium]